MIRKYRVNESLSLADFGFWKFLSFFAIWSLTNDNKYSKRFGAIRWYRKTSSLFSTKSWSNMWNEPCFLVGDKYFAHKAKLFSLSFQAPFSTFYFLFSIFRFLLANCNTVNHHNNLTHYLTSSCINNLKKFFMYVLIQNPSANK